MSAVEVRDRLADRFRLLRAFAPGPERQLTPAPRRGVVLRPPHRRRAGAAARDVGVRGRLRPGRASVPWRRATTTSTCCATSTHSCASRSSSPTTPSTRTRYRQFETIRQFAEDRLAADGRAGAPPETATPTYFAHGRHAALGALERARSGATRVDWVEVELGNLRAAYQWSRTARRRSTWPPTSPPTPRSWASPAQLFETLAWAEDVLARGERGRRGATPAPRTPRPGSPASPAGPSRGAAHAHRATELEADPRYDACEPGYATFVEALCSVYCGDLDRYVELTADVAQALRARARVRARGLRRRAAVERPHRRGPRAHRGIGRRRARASETRTGSPTRCGSRAWPSRRPTCGGRSQRGTKVLRSCASTACTSSRGSSPATRRGCTRHTARPRRQWCCSPMP